ncbi:GNAT family N-acetyltransferase [Alteromonas sp. LMIT006]|uniref:GNAT family N-acetyltransferase n=1 Tax=Alteromonadaceae TaxID=72275 RepID=UPI0020CA60FC|nr:GNAT family N-acetyltransferase [Alteromonas sp. LMIT006]UTP71865.1 GNAT family N-acetyltransferase [Alteromonas sp. LMIT006]
MVKFRSATHADKQILDDFLQGIITAERPMDHSLAPGHITYYDPMGFVDDPEAVLIVAEIDERVVGCGAVTIEPAKPYFKYDKVGHIQMMYVVPEHRGKGINRGVMDALIAFATGRGVANFKLTVYPDNEGAIRAYQKSGFYAALIEMRMHL